MSTGLRMLILCGLWLLTFAGSIILYQIAAPTANTLASGIELLLIFSVLQITAMLIGLGILVYWLVARRRLSRWARVVGILPPLTTVATIVFVAVWIYIH